MGQNKIAIILFSISLVVVIALITILSFGLLKTSWSYSYVVEPIDIVNILVTILVTIFVAWYVTKKLSEERFEKELIISDLKSIEECIKKILDAYEQQNANNQILALINQLHILINRFEKTVVSRQIKTNKLRNSFWNLFAAATDYNTANNTSNIDLLMVEHLGDELIIEVRRIIAKVNTK
jgi:hypothetical protein